MISTEDKLNEIERLLIDSIYEKALNKEPLNSYEMQLVIKWTKASKPTPKAPNSPCEPLVTQGQPLPFLKERLPLTEALSALEEVL